MTFSIDRRRGLAALAAIMTLTLAMPAQSLATEQLKQAEAVEVGKAKPAAGRKKLDTGLCTPGSSTFDIDKCYDEVKN